METVAWACDSRQIAIALRTWKSVCVCMSLSLRLREEGDFFDIAASFFFSYFFFPSPNVAAAVAAAAFVVVRGDTVTQHKAHL